ncbi:hypothetical protein GCM10023175_53780 [Pseudonocardia xishanensis]|uniref:Helix-turn-helix protein n=2 Tax=Pseudonocardia xishanensis TaxID=630995 RepID=A0ABP8RYU1_9PSEU
MCVSCGRRSGIARNTPLRSIVCGPCWFASGAAAEPSELVGQAHPPLTVLPRTAYEWAKAVMASEWFTKRRSDCAQRLRLLLRALALHADWEDHSSWPTWERLMQATGWSRSTMSSWLAELLRLGWMVRLERGTTPQFRPMALQHLEGNRAAVYQLRVPVSDADDATGDDASDGLTRTPTTSRNSSISREHVLPTRASGIFHSSSTNPQLKSTDVGPNGPRHEKKKPGHFDLRVPGSPAQMLAAAAELKRADRALWRLSPRAVRALFRPWWRAGWANSDVLHALNHSPAIGGSRRADRCPAAQLRRPEGWVKHRMSHWLDSGTPLTAPRLVGALTEAVTARHGNAAAARLPYGATTLRPQDLQVSKQEHAAAAESIARRWAREFHERRNERCPDSELASPQTRRAAVTGWKTLAADQAATPAPEPTQTTHPEQPNAPRPAQPSPTTEPSTTSTVDSGSAHDRAIERARLEGRAARPRRNRRRNRW